MNSSFTFRAAALLSFLVVAGLAAQGPTVWDGVYTEDQAMRGQSVYKDKCQSCHGETLDGGMGPSLSGTGFLSDWDGRSVGDLVTQTQATMPADDPGKMTLRQVADSIAYVLARNSLPAGQQELGVDIEALNQIRITAKK